MVNLLALPFLTTQMLVEHSAGVATRLWYLTKQHASFADIFVTLRCESAREHISTLGLSGPGSRKINHIVEHLTQLAV